MLLTLAASCFLRQGVSEISLTVTEANSDAIGLYRVEGYECTHKFDAAVWQREQWLELIAGQGMKPRPFKTQTYSGFLRDAGLPRDQNITN